MFRGSLKKLSHTRTVLYSTVQYCTGYRYPVPRRGTVPGTVQYGTVRYEYQVPTVHGTVLYGRYLYGTRYLVPVPITCNLYGTVPGNL
jgi:hypothetical protein